MIIISRRSRPLQFSKALQQAYQAHHSVVRRSGRRTLLTESRLRYTRPRLAQCGTTSGASLLLADEIPNRSKTWGTAQADRAVLTPWHPLAGRYHALTRRVLSFRGAVPKAAIKVHFQARRGTFALKQFFSYLVEVRFGEEITIRRRVLGRSAKAPACDALHEQGNARGPDDHQRVCLHSRRPRDPPFFAVSRADRHRDRPARAEHAALGWDAPVCGVISP